MDRGEFRPRNMPEFDDVFARRPTAELSLGGQQVGAGFDAPCVYEPTDDFEVRGGVSRLRPCTVRDHEAPRIGSMLCRHHDHSIV